MIGSPRGDSSAARSPATGTGISRNADLFAAVLTVSLQRGDDRGIHSMTNAQPGSGLLRLRRAIQGYAAEGQSDEELLRRFVAAREEAAFTALVRRHGPMVLGVCQRVLHNRQDAEDAFQATFLVLARRAPSLREPARLGGWLYVVASRVARTARERAARRRIRERQAAPMPDAEPPPDGSWQELRTLLDEELNQLPEEE